MSVCESVCVCVCACVCVCLQTEKPTEEPCPRRGEAAQNFTVNNPSELRDSYTGGKSPGPPTCLSHFH